MCHPHYESAQLRERCFWADKLHGHRREASDQRFASHRQEAGNQAAARRLPRHTTRMRSMLEANKDSCAVTHPASAVAEQLSFTKRREWSKALVSAQYGFGNIRLTPCLTPRAPPHAHPARRAARRALRPARHATPRPHLALARPAHLARVPAARRGPSAVSAAAHLWFQLLGWGLTFCSFERVKGFKWCNVPGVEKGLA